MDDMSPPQAFWKLHGLLKEAHLHDSPLAPGDSPCSSLDPSELFGLAEELVETFLGPQPDASLARAADRIGYAAQQLRGARADLLEAEEALGRLAPPRPWHYVTEKLPEPRQRVLFWITGGPEARRPLVGTYAPDDGGKEWRSQLGMLWMTGESPLLPEPLPTADEAYGILSPAHPLNGGAGFNEDGKEAAGPPVDPDVLQALKDTARMERKR